MLADRFLQLSEYKGNYTCAKIPLVASKLVMHGKKLQSNEGEREVNMIEDSPTLTQKNLRCMIDYSDSFLSNDPTQTILIIGYYSAFDLLYLEIF